MLDTPVIDLYIAVRHFCRCGGTGEWWCVFELQVAKIKGGQDANQSRLKWTCEDSDSNIWFKSCSPRMWKKLGSDCDTEDNERANKGEREDGRPPCAQRSCGSVFLINDSSNDGKCCCTFALLMTKTR